MLRGARGLALGLGATLLGCSPFNLDTTPGTDSSQDVDVPGPTQVGEEVHQSFSMPGVRVSQAGDQLVWNLEIYDPGATYVAPHFAELDLPGGARLSVQSPDGLRSQTYTGTGKKSLGDGDGFWSIPIPGDTAIIQVVTDVSIPDGAVEIDRFASGFPEQGPIGAICNGDDSDWAQCYEVSEPEIYDESKAVARLLINGTGACTGWLVGDEGHLLTNQHCIDSASDAANTSYEFMAEGSCGTDCSGWGDCPGNVVADSATLLQASSTYDYALVKLPVNPTDDYGYMQLREEGATVGERIYIPQHPAAMGKKIAVNSTHSTDESGYAEVYSTDESPCFGTGSDVGYYADTQGGSSGSPVLGYDDHLVVALHHCANCPNRGVPIQSVIDGLGSLLPDSALGSAPPPPPPPPPPDEVTVLENGVTVAGIDGNDGTWRHYKIDVPGGQESLTVETAGGSGDADVYVRFGAQPDSSNWDYRPYKWGNDETVDVSTPAEGEWFVSLHAYDTYSGVSLTATHVAMPGDGVTELGNGQTVSGLGAPDGDWLHYKVWVPSGESQLQVQIWGGSGDADVYVRRGEQPTTSQYDHRPYLWGNNETVTVSSPASDWWYVGIRAYDTFSGVSLQASY